MVCSSSCRTKDHESYGACLRAKNLKTSELVEAKGVSRDDQRRVDKALDLYQQARKEGIQPKSTRLADTRMAMEISDKTGTAFQA